MSACGTIIHGTSQDIGFQSNPTSAKLTVDDILRRQTPAVVPLAHKRALIVRLELDGCKPYEATITKTDRTASPIGVGENSETKCRSRVLHGQGESLIQLDRGENRRSLL